MISVDAILYGPQHKLLSSNCFDNSTVIQVVGNDPKKLGKVAKIVEKYGYTGSFKYWLSFKQSEVGNFGACLMASPQIVSDCVKSIKIIQT